MAKGSPFLCMFTRVASRPKFLGGFFYCFAAIGLSACASGGSALVDSVQFLARHSVAGSQTSASASRYDPNLRYLSAQLNDGPVAVLVLGYVDSTPQGAVEVWYSANAEVLRLLDGRVVSTQGLSMDWTRGRFDPAPVAWRSLDTAPATSVRFHDELPSYRFGVADRVQTQLWHGAAQPRWRVPAEVQSAKDLRWFKETAQETGGVSSTQVSWFAWDATPAADAIVYSEQCLSPMLCLRLQRVPLSKEKP